MPLFDDQKAREKLTNLKSLEEEDLAEWTAKRHGLGYTDLTIVQPSPGALSLLPEAEARRLLVVPFLREGKLVSLAVLDPESSGSKEAIATLTTLGYQLTIFICSRKSLEHAWQRYSEFSKAQESEAGIIEISNKNITGFLEKIKEVADVAELIAAEEKNENPNQQISRVLELVIAGALATKASDIHLEPEEKESRLRLRLDGVLHDVASLKHDVYKKILSRLKLVSGLKLNINKNSQDGRFTIRLPEGEIEIRTSVVPGAYGESVVMRVLNPQGILVDFETLGIDARLAKVVEETLAKPQGLILNTGPTGSGKTTSLYAFLRKTSTTESKVITIEDPIEYHLEGITQTQVKEGYDFAEGLKSALRQDPDIIMVGEIRDSETARTAIQAALTGHLVFSTLHTNNAAGTIPRLIDLEVEPKIIGSALTLALAQRLVRILCPACKKGRSLTEEEKKTTQTIIEKAPEALRSDIGQAEGVLVYDPVGCPECGGSGFKGRTGVFEGIKMSKEIEETTTTNPGERDVRRASRVQNLLTMREHGLSKVLSGITSFSELARVVDLGEE